ncbi:MAG: glycosyltransferase family 9 protein [Candidatus Omnitrophica bacterium]|nr:glycosyltransferase family 9 protein [Candidatus Omnitrophota bacterium]
MIVRTDRIGDVVLSTPVIRNLRAAFPDAYLGMMVRPEHRELIEGNPDLNAVILYDKFGAEKGILGNLRFAQRLREHRFDTAVILHSTNRVIWAAWMAGIRRRVGYARRLPWMLTQRIPYIKREGNRHELEYNLDLLQLLGVESKERALFVPTTAEQEEKVRQFLAQEGIREDRPLVVLHPGASCPSKRWPTEHFARVGDRLTREQNARVVVIAGADGIAQGQAVLGRMREKSVNALARFTLGELVCLFRHAACVVSNDSGPVHLACAAGTPVVSIFGRWGGGLSPTRWGPTGPRDVVLHHDVGCRPCLAHGCTIGFVCLKAVTVEEVLIAAEELIGEKAESRG